jgi:alpha/beta hydrolase family protein
MLRTASLGASMLLLATVACRGGGSDQSSGPLATQARPAGELLGRADIGGYELAYQCDGSGAPTVILEAGYGASGLDTWPDTMQRLAPTTRVCTYDRAGIGISSSRPSSVPRPLNGDAEAEELHGMLQKIGVGPPYVLVGHSYGGMVVRTFEGRYPDEVAGIVLIDASSEPEIPIYERLHAGAWIDGEDKVDIHSMVGRLHAAGDLGSTPLVVITAGILDDKWLKQFPQAEAKAQARLASLSSDSVHVLATGSHHFVQDENPSLVEESIRQVVQAVRDGSQLPGCQQTFASLHGECLGA